MKVKKYKSEDKMVINKKAEMQVVPILILGAILLIASAQFGGLGNLFSSAVGGQTGEDGEAPSGPGLDLSTVCADPSNTMTVGPMQRRFNPATSMASENVRTWIDGVDQGTSADSSTRTVGDCQEIAIIYGYQSGTHYSDGAVFTAPCSPFVSASKDGNSHLLWQHDTNITITATNGDNGNVNDGIGTSNESIGSGEIGRFTLKLEADNLQALSPKRNVWNPTKLTPEYFPGQSRPDASKIIIVVEVNGSRYDVAQTTISGGEAVKDNSYFPAGIYATSNVDSKTTTFIVDGCPREGQKICNINLGTLSVQAKTGENPPGGYATGAAGVGDGDIRLEIYNQDWETHTEKPIVVFGTEQDDSTIAGFALQEAHLDVV